MKKIANSGFILLILSTTVACHRPYALLQRTPAEQYTYKRPSISAAPIRTDSSDLAELDWPIDSLPVEATVPPMLASTASELVEPTTSRVQRHIQSARRLLAESESQPLSDKQPRPKPKTQKKGMTFREFFGLPEKRPKTWWQRVNWNLKAGFILILIAVGFALLKITILAIIFGVLAALIILRGLRKTWKRGGFLGL